MNEDLLQGSLFVLAALIIILVAISLYLILLVMRVELLLHRIGRLLRPQVARDNNGRPLKERI